MNLSFSIKRTLIFLAIIIFCTFITYTAIYNYKITDNILNQNKDYQRKILQEIYNSVSTNVKNTENILLNFTCSEVLQSYIQETNPPERILMSSKIDKECVSRQNLMTGIYDFIYISDNVEYFYKGRNLLTYSLLQDIYKRHGNESIYFSEVFEVSIDGLKRNVIMISMPVYKMSGNSLSLNQIGYAAMVVDKSIFSIQTHNDISSPMFKLYMMDRNNNIYSRSFNDDKYLITGSDLNDVAEKTDYFTEEVSIPRLNGKIVILTHKNQMFGTLYETQSQMLAIGIALAALLLILLVTVIGSILAPLNKFTKYLAEIKTSGISMFKSRIELGGYSEIRLMAESFNNLLSEIKQITDRLFKTTTRLYETELEKKQAELMQLRGQINPHFLYNTLEVCKGMAFEHGAYNVVELVTLLGSIFKYSVKGEGEVMLKEELTIVDSYIKIQAMRFGPRLSYEYNIPEELSETIIPKMILQPIVENAIFHGVEKQQKGGHISISAKADNETLVVSVHDNGAGFSEEDLVSIQSKIKNVDILKSNQKVDSIGILNVNNRLKLMYGNEYGLEIKSAPHDTTVKIKVKIN